MQSIQQLEATLAILDKEYKENAEKAADYRDKVSILFAKWNILQDELLELKKQCAKEEAIFTVEQSGNLRASIQHILMTICKGMRYYYSDIKLEELDIKYIIDSECGKEMCDRCSAELKSCRFPNCNEHIECGHCNKYKFDMSCKFLEGCYENGCWGRETNSQLQFSIIITVINAEVQTKIMEMFKHVKEDLIQRENEKNERKQRENKEVYELREQLLPFIKKADEIIEEYTKI
uniref:Uncharacterized protein n=1 Tax=viral metagenome TaxID=1070528 RepID=A0A6C0K9X2_9ZZZZ